MLELKERTVIEKIKSLKKEKDFLILAHNYQRLEIQEAADMVGDSFELCKTAHSSQQSNIAICGVSFMAETAAVLNPEKNIFSPEKNAHCTMAEMLKEEDVLQIKEKHPSAAVMCYINSTLELKSVSDVVCTSSNAVKLAKRLGKKEIIFVPDKNLGNYVAGILKDFDIITASAFCYVHHEIYPEDIKKTRNDCPQALVLCHPECQEQVTSICDFVGSTSAMLNYVSESSEREFIVCTEEGHLDRLRTLHPDKKFIAPLFPRLCYGMKKNTLESLIETLENPGNPLSIPAQLAEKARRPILRMMELSA